MKSDIEIPRRELEARLQVAVELGRQAGAILLDHFGRLRGSEVDYKGRRDLCTVADRAAEEFVVRRLQALYPDEGILAEEGVATPRGRAHLVSRWVWIVDPLDGTTNFAHGFPHFSVSIGLWRDGEPVLGAIYAPMTKEIFTGIVGVGAWRQGEPIAVSGIQELERALVCTGFPYNRSEPGADTNLERFARMLPVCQGIRRTGSVCLDLSYLAAGKLDAFWEIGLAPYDLAAGTAIVLGAGGRVTTLAGGKDYLESGRLAASNGSLHNRLLALVGAGGAQSVKE